jgi:hypothetical protein
VSPHLCPLAKLLRVPWNNIVNLAKICLNLAKDACHHGPLGNWKQNTETYHLALSPSIIVYTLNMKQKHPKAEQSTKLAPYLKGTLKILRHGIMPKLLGRRIREHYTCMLNNENPWMYSNSRCLQPQMWVQDAIHHQLDFHPKYYIGLKSFPSWHSQLTYLAMRLPPLVNDERHKFNNALGKIK